MPILQFPMVRLSAAFIRRAALPGLLSAFLLFSGIAGLDPRSAGAAEQTYVVQSGDTLGRIAANHAVNLSTLVSANGISNPDLIYPGQVLVIPGGGRSVVETSARGAARPVLAEEPAAAAVNVQWVRWKVTMYCLSGQMANGEYVHQGAAAADASILPLGAQVYLEGFGTLTIKDRFAWDGGDYRIDVWEPSCARAYQWGVRYVDGYVVG